MVVDGLYPSGFRSGSDKSFRVRIVSISLQQYLTSKNLESDVTHGCWCRVPPVVVTGIFARVVCDRWLFMCDTILGLVLFVVVAGIIIIVLVLVLIVMMVRV